MQPWRQIMALLAMSPDDTFDFVSLRDPSAVIEQVPNDPKNPGAGSHPEVVSWKADASVFKVRPLDPFLMGMIYDDASRVQATAGSNTVGVTTRINQTNAEAVRFGLAALPPGWMDTKGRPVQYITNKINRNGRTYEAVQDSVLTALGNGLISELAEKIHAISEVTVGEEKNSGAA